MFDYKKFYFMFSLWNENHKIKKKKIPIYEIHDLLEKDFYSDIEHDYKNLHEFILVTLNNYYRLYDNYKNSQIKASKNSFYSLIATVFAMEHLFNLIRKSPYGKEVIGEYDKEMNFWASNALMQETKGRDDTFKKSYEAGLVIHLFEIYLKDCQKLSDYKIKKIKKLRKLMFAVFEDFYKKEDGFGISADTVENYFIEYTGVYRYDDLDIYFTANFNMHQLYSYFQRNPVSNYKIQDSELNNYYQKFYSCLESFGIFEPYNT